MSGTTTAEIIRLDNDEPSQLTVQLALEEALGDIKAGRIQAQKVVIAFVDSETEVSVDGVPYQGYNIDMRTGGISCVEAISLMEMCKTRFLQWMGLIPS